MNDPVVEANRALLLKRSQLGINKYGVTLASSGLSRRQLLQHALEESLDLANYLQAELMREDASMPVAVQQTPNQLHPEVTAAVAAFVRSCGSVEPAEEREISDAMWTAANDSARRNISPPLRLDSMLSHRWGYWFMLGMSGYPAPRLPGHDMCAWTAGMSHIRKPTGHHPV